ncbi:HD-GYP domain-containing protein [Oceanobacillus saliphilus]|uniref:HD-GYP domain-containing protein n=1 Tax=Oceanobacillus saliphilus TaxID=2925834 RepID=UPI00201DC787|nr:HD-GYP domain-containing protein [Oceanobacillus saliphilus]
MRVEPSQLVPGCILLHEVKGKSNRPIIPKNTVLTEKHIIILEKFLIESVEVSSKLSDGEEFQPKVVHRSVKKQDVTKTIESGLSNIPFADHYRATALKFKEQYQKWQNSMPIDIPSVRDMIIPLLDRIEEVTSKEIYSLHKHVEKEDYIHYHSVAVSIISAFLGRKMGYSKGEWLQIGLAGLLCDCGMVRVNSDIIFKAGPLTSNEFKDVQNHPTYSYRMVENLPTITSGVKLAVLQHHEREDGNGYPLGIKNEKIHKYAKVIAVADTYHAMTSDRLYQGKIPPMKVIEEIQKEQYIKFDAEVVKCFLGSLSDLSLGSKVTLSNKKSGEIVFVDPDKPTRPLIRMNGSDEIIALEHMPELYIEKVSGS